jgi:cytochrome c oxidase cbb3-type subunit 3
MRSSGRLSPSVTLALGLCFLFVGCEPPGKPEREKQPEEITDFSVLYEQNCAGCHGENGKDGPGRILNDSLYLSILPREILRDIIIHGRRGTSMPAWAKSEGGPLTPKQIDALVNGMEQHWAKAVDFNGAGRVPYSAGDQQGNAESGRKLFLRSCFMCHGPGAKVGSVTDPSYLALVTDQMLRTSIIVGRPDLGMPDYRHLKLGKALTNEDISDLVAFLVSKRPAGPAVESGAPMTANSGTGSQGATSRGNEGSGNGPGSPRRERGEGNKSTGASSQQGIK